MQKKHVRTMCDMRTRWKETWNLHIEIEVFTFNEVFFQVSPWKKNECNAPWDGQSRMGVEQSCDGEKNTPRNFMGSYGGYKSHRKKCYLGYPTFRNKSAWSKIRIDRYRQEWGTDFPPWVRADGFAGRVTSCKNQCTVSAQKNIISCDNYIIGNSSTPWPR